MPISAAAELEQAGLSKLESCFIVSIYPETIPVNRNEGYFELKGAPPGATKQTPTETLPYSLTEIGDRGVRDDMGRDRKPLRKIGCRDLAADMVKENADFGLAVISGAVPTVQELQAIRDRRDAYYEKLVRRADRDWERYHRSDMISDVARAAVHYFQADRSGSWMTRAAAARVCEICGSDIKESVVKCPNCLEIVDYQRAYDLDMLSPERVEWAVRKGKLVLPGPAESSLGPDDEDEEVEDEDWPEGEAQEAAPPEPAPPTPEPVASAPSQPRRVVRHRRKKQRQNLTPEQRQAIGERLKAGRAAKLAQRQEAQP